MAQIAGSIGAKGLSSRLVSIFFRKIGCPPTMMVVLSLSMAKLCVFPDLPLSMDSAECAHKPEDPELRLGPPETPLERGKASLPSLNELPPILYEQQIQIPGRNLINVELEKNEMASIINQLPKNELQGVLGEDSIRKPLNEFNAEQQGQLKDLAINHFAVKNEIIAQMKYLYPGDEWEFTKVIREKFFQGRQKGREFDLEHLQKMLSALKERGKSSSCAAREWEGGSLLIGPAWILVGARPTEVFLRNHIRMQFSAHPSERGTALAELSLLDSRRVQGFCELARTGKEASPAGPTLKCPQTASPHQAASIAKCSATKQALPNTTDAEVGKPEVAKEVGGRKYTLRASFYPTGFRTGQYGTSCLGLWKQAANPAIAPKSISSLGLCHTSEFEAMLSTKVVDDAKRLWRTKVPLGAKGRGDSKTTNANISLNCLGETPHTTRIEDAPLVRKHNRLACGANDDLRLQEGKRQPPLSKYFFEGGALLYSFARETST
ncbi:hypothetical protein Tco_0668842 [Tanacetum coccineum]